MPLLNPALDHPHTASGCDRERIPAITLLKSRAHVLSLGVPLALFTLLILLVRPWGNYPLNDDWIYARILKRFVETGKFVFDHDTGAAFIGQGLIAAPIVRLFGFSHLNLRLLTIGFSGLLLFLVWWLLSSAGVRPRIKAIALCLLITNPIFAYVSMTFMTDIYGYTLALLGAVWWFSGRRKADRRQSAAIVPWGTAVGTGFAVGASFWVRQYCVMVYPALLGAAILSVWNHGNWRRLRSSIPRLAVSATVLAAVISAYFVFAKKMAMVPMSDYSGRLQRMQAFSPMAAAVAAGIFITYMTLFFFPLLAGFRIRALSRKLLAVGGALAILGLLSAGVMSGIPSYAVDLHRRFPFLSNIINNAGVGPVLLPDVQFPHLAPGPQWPAAVWIVIECLLLAGNVLWALAIPRSWSLLRQARHRSAGELVWFGYLFVFASLTVTILVDKMAVFDRYYLPELLGLLLALSVSLGLPATDGEARGPSWRLAAGLLPLALFTTAGLHDYFRWNDIRWAFFQDALNHGVSPMNLQAGYEPNGWAGYSAFLENTKPPACIGPCQCDQGWFCRDDSYRIAMSVYGDYEVVASRRPDYWLADGPPIYLSRRKLPRP
jgi:hypothetical protein